MSYESFRATVSASLLSKLSPETLQEVLSALDVISVGYDIHRQNTDLTIVGDVPEIVKIYIAAKAVENLSQLTLAGYYRQLVTFFSTVRKPFNLIDTNDIRVYLYNYKVERNVKDSTLEGIRIALNSFFEWCQDAEYIAKNPVRRISPIKFEYAARKPMSHLELETIRSSCVTLREKALVDFLYSTAGRVSEVVNMQIENVDLKEGTIFIEKGKGGKPRRSYLNPEAIVSLKAYLKSRKDDSPYLFVKERSPHTKLTVKAVQDEVQKIATRAGIQSHITPHIFRHTAATSAIRAGMPVEQVQKFLGHTRLDTTMIYAKTDDTEVKANHSKYIA